MGTLMKLNKSSFGWIGTVFDQKTRISPFSNAGAESFTESDQKSLLEQGIIDNEGKINASFYAVLKVLADCNAFANIRLSGSFGRLDKTVYFADNKKVFVDAAKDGFIVSEGVFDESPLNIISQLTGLSRLTNSELNIKTDICTGLMLSALIDLTRRSALLRYADNSKFERSFSAGDISDAAKSLTGSKWLTGYIKQIYGADIDFSAEETARSLDALVRFNMAAESESKYVLIGEAFDLAANFLIIENAVRLYCGRESDGNIITTGCLFLQAGIYDVLMIDFSDNLLELSAVSPYVMNEYLNQALLTKPAL